MKELLQVEHLAILAGVAPIWRLTASRLSGVLAFALPSTFSQHKVRIFQIVWNYTKMCTLGCAGSGGSKGKALCTVRQGKAPVISSSRLAWKELER